MDEQTSTIFPVRVTAFIGDITVIIKVILNVSNFCYIDLVKNLPRFVPVFERPTELIKAVNENIN